MRGEGEINRAAEFQQRGALGKLSRIEDDLSALAAIAGSRISCRNLNRTTEQFGSGCADLSVQALMIVAGRILAHGDQIHCAIARDRALIDDRRCGDADLGRDLAAAVIVAGNFAEAQHRDMPELTAVAGGECVHAVILVTT